MTKISLEGFLIILFYLAPTFTSFSWEIKAEDKQILEKFYSAKTINEIDLYLDAFEAVKTDDEFEKNYRKGLDLLDTLYSRFYQFETQYIRELKEKEAYFDPTYTCLPDLEPLNGKLGPIMFSCVAECTEMDFNFDKGVLKDKAVSTKGTADDEILDLAIFIDNGEWGKIADWDFKVWFQQTWDYGGHSLIGEGQMTAAINRIQAYEKKYDGYRDELKKYKEMMLNDLSEWWTFMYTKDKVMDEFDAILRTEYFNQEETQKILDHIKAMNEPDSLAEFDCKNKSCRAG